MHTHAQTLLQKQKMAQTVFENVVNAYGNAKAAPILIILPNTKKERVVAAYSSTPQPTIRVDEQLIDICLQLKVDSLNALATIISHELAHYYNDHTFCSDYAFATNNKKLMEASKDSRVEKETKADRDGIFYAMIAGYKPLQSFENILTIIYKKYKLPVNLLGYPTLTERKKIITYQTGEVKNLLAVYNAGILLLYLNYLPESADCFAYLSVYFPSREVYNNLGVSKFLQAVQLITNDTLNVIYPIDIDPVSRLYISTTRGTDTEIKDYKLILKEAKKYFEKAKSLDPLYCASFLNLVCTNTALHNYEMAIGDINEATELINKDEVQLTHINALIKLKQNKVTEALAMLESIKQKDSLAAYNYNLVKTAVNNNYNNIKIESYKDEWLNYLLNTNNKVCTKFGFSKYTYKTININATLKINTSNYNNFEIIFTNKKIKVNIEDGKDVTQNGLQITNKMSGCLLVKSKVIKYEVE